MKNNLPKKKPAKFKELVAQRSIDECFDYGLENKEGNNILLLEIPNTFG